MNHRKATVESIILICGLFAGGFAKGGDIIIGSILLVTGFFIILFDILTSDEIEQSCE